MSKPVCPDDCSSYLANMNFNDCSPEWNEGEVHHVYLYGVGYPVVADPKTDPAAFIAEMAARVSNTSAAANAIRRLTVLGEKPEAETNKIQMSNDREITTFKKHTLSFKVDELSQENNDAMRQMECQNQYLMMFENGQLIYGGSDHIGDGIPCTVTVNLVIPPDRTALTYWQCQAVWKDKYHPDMCVNPLL